MILSKLSTGEIILFIESLIIFNPFYHFRNSFFFYCKGVSPEATKGTVDQRGSLEMLHKESLPEAYFNISV